MNGSESLLHTPLYDRHVRLGAKMAPFAGYAMPIMYSGIAAEHRAVRSRAGLFDVSHMGRLVFRGEPGADALERLVTIHASALEPGHARYGCVLAEDAGVIDDVILYRLAAEEYLLVVNAANRGAVLAHLGALDGAADDRTEATAMLALQGPAAREVLARVMPHVAPPDLSMRVAATTWEEAPLLVATTGYTGEDGVEIIIPADRTDDLWDRLLDAGATPAGLGARDTLRLEMGYPLHGHELSTAITPWQAGIPWAVDLRNEAFCGRRRYLERREEPARRLAGLVALGRGVPRAGQDVLRGDATVGTVTSGTFSPSLERGIALAYVEPAIAGPSARVNVAPPDAHERRLAMEATKPPFYRHGSRRPSRR